MVVLLLLLLLLPWPSQGFWEQGNKAIYFRGTREQRSKIERNGETKGNLGNREHRKSDFDFGEQGEMQTYFRGTREQVFPQEGPYY